MRYLALASDFDGTLAHDGHVESHALEALTRLRASGRKMILVTGRQLPELQKTFPELAMCDLVVAENGALLYWPDSGKEEVLGEPPPEAFLSEMVAEGVAPFSVGRVIFATWRPHESAVLSAIERLGIGYHISFNKGAVMVLPEGINKASGLCRGLENLELSTSQIVGIGDAENDHAFLDHCGVAVAVANALPALKQHCDLVTEQGHGYGVAELVSQLVRDDLRHLGPRKSRMETRINSTRKS